MSPVFDTPADRDTSNAPVVDRHDLPAPPSQRIRNVLTTVSAAHAHAHGITVREIVGERAA